MSLQAVINPLEFMKSGPAMIGKKVRKANEEFDMSKTIDERQTAPGMTNMGGCESFIKNLDITYIPTFGRA